MSQRSTPKLNVNTASGFAIVKGATSGIASGMVIAALEAVGAMPVQVAGRFDPGRSVPTVKTTAADAPEAFPQPAPTTMQEPATVAPVIALVVVVKLLLVPYCAVVRMALMAVVLATKPDKTASLLNTAIFDVARATIKFINVLDAATSATVFVATSAGLLTPPPFTCSLSKRTPTYLLSVNTLLLAAETPAIALTALLDANASGAATDEANNKSMAVVEPATAFIAVVDSTSTRA